jgi:hypothetical protein
VDLLELTRQRSLPSPEWKGKEILAATGESVEQDHQTILGFSVLNSRKWNYSHFGSYSEY